MSNVFCISEYGHRDITEKAINSIIKEDPSASIFVGNDSFPEILPYVSYAKVFDWKKNVGCVRNCNRTVKEAGCNSEDILFVVDNDVVFFPNSVRPLADYANSYRAFVGPALIVPDHMGLINKQIYHQNTCKKRRLAPFNTTMLSGCCLVMQYSIWDELGGYDEDFYHQSCDCDLCVRAIALGIKVVCLPESLVSHEWGGTVNSEHPYLKDRLYEKDRETFNRKHPNFKWNESGDYS